MKPLRIAFDIDDTLILPGVITASGRETPNYANIEIFRYFQALGCEMILWSGSGVDWAKTWGEKLGLEPFTVQVKQKDETVDICFDDVADVDLAKVNVRVKRFKNGISRAEWNKTPPEEREV